MDLVVCLWWVGHFQKRYIQPILGYKTMVALLGMCSLSLHLPFWFRAIFGKIKKRPSWDNGNHSIYPQPVTDWAGLQSMCNAWMRRQSCSHCRLVKTHHHVRHAFRMLSAKHPHLPDSYVAYWISICCYKLLKLKWFIYSLVIDN